MYCNFFIVFFFDDKNKNKKANYLFSFQKEKGIITFINNLEFIKIFFHK